MALGARASWRELLGEIGLEFDVDEAGNAWTYLEGEDASAPALGARLPPRLGPERWLARRPARRDGGARRRSALGRSRAASLRGRWRWSTGPTRRERSAAACWEAARRRARSTRPSSRTRPARRAARWPRLWRRTASSSRGCPTPGARLDRIGDYIELHIEQGPVLAERGASAAAVTGCAGLERFVLRFTGQASHAGTTPMGSRRDAGLAAAAAALAGRGDRHGGRRSRDQRRHGVRARGDHRHPRRSRGVRRHPPPRGGPALVDARVDRRRRPARGRGGAAASSSRSPSGGSSRSPSTPSWWTSPRAAAPRSRARGSGWPAAPFTTLPRWLAGCRSR